MQEARFCTLTVDNIPARRYNRGSCKNNKKVIKTTLLLFISHTSLPRMDRHSIRPEDLMNIGIFTDTYYPQINGVATSISTLRDELQKRGHNVFLFTAKDPAINEKELNIFRLSSMPFVFSPAHRATYMCPPRLLMRMRTFELDIIHTHTEFSLGLLGKIISQSLGKPHVHTYHTMYEEYTHYVANGHLVSRGMARRFSRFFCNRADTVIAPVQSTRERLLQYGVRCPIEVIPTGINFRPLNKENYPAEETAALKASLGIKPNCPIIINIGRVAREKNIPALINAMPKLLKHLPDAKLVIVGNGPIIGEMTTLAATRGVNGSVLFAGGKPLSEIGRYYQLGDVFATASTSETQGLTYYEAMASGVPVVAKRDTSIATTLVDGFNSYLFDSDCQLADTLHKALSSKDQHKMLTHNAYETITPLSSAKFGESIEQLYSNMVEQNKNKRNRWPWKR